MRNMRIMHEKKHQSVQPQESRTSKALDARIAAMRAQGMSATAIRRALGLSEAAATAVGLLGPGRLAPAPDPGPARVSAPSGLVPRVPSVTEILDAVAQGTGIDREAMIAPCHRRSEVRARHLVMCLIRELCPGVSLAAIGEVLARDPATVLYGCRRAEALRRRDRAFRETHLRIRRALVDGNPEAGSRG